MTSPASCRSDQPLHAEAAGPDQSLRFLVAFHVEGSPTTWQRNAELSLAAEERVLSQISRLRLWSAPWHEPADGEGRRRKLPTFSSPRSFSR